MPIIAPLDEFDAEEADTYKRLSRREAQALREAHPAVSPWWVVIGQIGLGLFVALVAWWFWGGGVALSVVCGVLAAVIPAALFARGLTSQFAAANPGAAVVSFFVWEFVKILVTISVLFAAHRLVKDLSWPAMLVGLVLSLKVYWLVLAFKRRPSSV
ncbi:ATP synthase subunit I [Rhodoferax sp.]|uniref:ATP synthase subunit I n=1 Tax=Rhodoferax sp. TaxID=50421 RepID=UPI00283BB4EE|nr:ATP synthase subunit I [Rhodoferax sp.]MDR3367935.1 ATP synthase subunit I [Rhodoferax sp.]